MPVYALPSLHPRNLPPVFEDVPLDVFEQIAASRLQLLILSNSATLRKKYESDHILKIGGLAVTDGGRGLAYDLMSHHILRLALSQEVELKYWLISAELRLFRQRLSLLDPEIVDSLVEDESGEFQTVAPAELQSQHPGLIFDLWRLYRATGNAEEYETFLHSIYYKIPFMSAPSLLRTRRCVLRQGILYVPRRDMVHVIADIYREQLFQAMPIASRCRLQLMEQDERIAAVFSKIETAARQACSVPEEPFSFSLFSQRGEENADEQSQLLLSVEKVDVRITNLDEVAHESFPLCMKILHERLRAVHHLKYDGRLQYVIFLQHIGMPLEDVVKLWRTEFTKSVSKAEYQKKKYEYSVRHLYGEEGSRSKKPPRSCDIILSRPPPVGDQVHGCPFKVWSLDVLTEKLSEFGILAQSREMQQIASHISKGEYQEACRSQFHSLHRGITMSQQVHPNRWFELSAAYNAARRKGLFKDEATFAEADGED